MVEATIEIGKKIADSPTGGEILQSGVKDVLSPELITHTGKLFDDIQEILVNTYRLPHHLSSYKASRFLWPNVTSKPAEEFIQQQMESGDPRPFVMLTADFIDGGLAPRISPKSVQNAIKHALVARGRIPYTDLKPVIFIPPEVMEQLKGKELDQLVTPKGIPLFVPIVEEVSHFLYQQSQYLNNRRLPGDLMSEGIAILDWYLTLKQLVKSPIEGKTPVNIIQEAWETMTQKRSTIPFVYRDLLHYKRAYKIIKGFVDHLVQDDQSGVDNQDELRNFYLLDGKRKMDYLLDLYQRLMDSGLQSYYFHLLDVKGSQLSSEFRRK